MQFVDQVSGKAEIKFLNAVDYLLEKFHSANVDAIKSMTMKQIDDSKLDVSRLSALATDSCSLTTGKRNGVAALIHREWKLVVNVQYHCRALACGKANDHPKRGKHPGIQLWSFFKNSAKATIAAKSVTLSNTGKKASQKVQEACKTR